MRNKGLLTSRMQSSSKCRNFCPCHGISLRPLEKMLKILAHSPLRYLIMVFTFLSCRLLQGECRHQWDQLINVCQVLEPGSWTATQCGICCKCGFLLPWGEWGQQAEARSSTQYHVARSASTDGLNYSQAPGNGRVVYWFQHTSFPLTGHTILL